MRWLKINARASYLSAHKESRRIPQLSCFVCTRAGRRCEADAFCRVLLQRSYRMGEGNWMMDSQMKGKTCIVTGATNGIGEVTARTLAQMGATVVGVGRSPSKCAETERRIKDATGNGQVEFLVADLSSQKDVRKLAEQIMLKYPRLDVLVNNAGGYFTTRQESVDGIEMTWALNHLSYFLLTTLLLDHLKASAPA